MKNLVFVHGWAFDANFWTPLQSRIEAIYKDQISVTIADLGFLQDTQNIPFAQDAVYITHSLGTMWALKKRHESIKALIAINGFTQFSEFVGKNVLRAMKMRLNKTPHEQIGDFQKLCGLKNNIDITNINTPRLNEGLEWLEHWACSKELKALNVPVKVLAGEHDRICALSNMDKHWAEQGHNIELCPKGDHILPISQTQWCTEQIEAFLNEQ